MKTQTRRQKPVSALDAVAELLPRAPVERYGMEEPNGLTAEERARGQVLACVARPVALVTVEVP